MRRATSNFVNNSSALPPTPNPFIPSLHGNADVCAAAVDYMRHAAGTWPHTFEHWAAVDSGVFHDETANIRRSQVFRVAERALDQLFEHPRSALWLITQDRQRIIDGFA